MDIQWIRLYTGFLQNSKIRYLRSEPEGDALLAAWIGMLCRAGQLNDGGRVYLAKGQPFGANELAVDVDVSLEIAEKALVLFENLKMIRRGKNGVCRILSWEEHQNIEGMKRLREKSRERQAKHRSRRKTSEEVSDEAVTDDPYYEDGMPDDTLYEEPVSGGRSRTMAASKRTRTYQIRAEITDDEGTTADHSDTKTMQETSEEENDSMTAPTQRSTARVRGEIRRETATENGSMAAATQRSTARVRGVNRRETAAENAGMAASSQRCTDCVSEKNGLAPAADNDCTNASKGKTGGAVAECAARAAAGSASKAVQAEKKTGNRRAEQSRQPSEAASMKAAEPDQPENTVSAHQKAAASKKPVCQHAAAGKASGAVRNVSAVQPGSHAVPSASYWSRTEDAPRYSPQNRAFVTEMRIDSAWKTDIRARNRTAHLIADEILNRGQQLELTKNLHEAVMMGLDRGLPPEEILEKAAVMTWSEFASNMAVGPEFFRARREGHRRFLAYTE